MKMTSGVGGKGFCKFIKYILIVKNAKAFKHQNV